MTEILEEKRELPNKLVPLLLLVCLGLLGFLFAPHVGKLYELWTDEVNTSYSHSLLIPLVIVYLIWDKRGELLKLNVIPSWAGGGLALVICGLIWMVAVGGKSRWAIEMCMAGMLISLVWLNWGTEITKRLSFPLFLLFMMVPLPKIVYAQISNQLQLLSSKMAVGFMHLFAVPVLRQGNIIHLPHTQLEVAQACSGISSLISLFTLSMIFAYVMQKGFWVRLLLVLCSLPIAVFMNWLRIAATGMMTHYVSEEIAQGFYHSFSGWLVFVVAFLILWAANGFLNLFGRAKG